MSILSNDPDIKFRLGDYYKILSYGRYGENRDLLISGIYDIELDTDYKIRTKKVRHVVRKIFGENYCVKRIALASSWRFECYPSEYKDLAKHLWNIPGRVEFYIDREIHLS